MLAKNDDTFFTHPVVERVKESSLNKLLITNFYVGINWKDGNIGAIAEFHNSGPTQMKRFLNASSGDLQC